MRGEVAVAQLLLQATGEALLYGEGVVFRAGVLTPVVYMEVVGGDVVVLGAVVLFHGAAALLLFLYLRYGNIVLFGGLFKHGIVIENLLNMLLQGLHRHFYQLDGLNLKR